MSFWNSRSATLVPYSLSERTRHLEISFSGLSTCGMCITSTRTINIPAYPKFRQRIKELYERRRLLRGPTSTRHLSHLQYSAGRLVTTIAATANATTALSSTMEEHTTSALKILKLTFLIAFTRHNCVQSEYRLTCFVIRILCSF
jgi:hypothetical protein